MGNISRAVLRALSNIQMFDKVLIRLTYQAICFKLEEIKRRLTEHEGTGPRAGGLWSHKSNRQDAKKTKFNTKSITYSESTSKIMVRSRWTVFNILLMSS